MYDSCRTSFAQLTCLLRCPAAERVKLGLAMVRCRWMVLVMLAIDPAVGKANVSCCLYIRAQARQSNTV